MVRIGDAFLLVGGGTPSTAIESYWGAGTPWFSSADIDSSGKITFRRRVTDDGINNSTTNIVSKNTVVVVTRVGLGKVAKLKEDMCFSQDIQALIPKNGIEIDADYLCYQMRFHMQSMKYKGQGTTIAGITKKQLSDVEILLPNYTKQRRTVAHIEELFSELDNGVEALRKTKRQLAVYRQAVLKEAFQKCIDRVPIQSVCKCVTDGDHMPPPKAPSGVPFVMISNVENSKILWDNTAYVSREYFNAIDSKRKPKKGDVLYTVTGSYGIPILVDFKKEFCFQRHIALLRPNDNTLSEFLYYALMEPSVYAQATKGATGTAQKTVGLGVLRRMVIPYTSSIELQERIVSKIEGRLSMCEHISETVDVALHEAEVMRQSILKQAFEGKLT